MPTWHTCGTVAEFRNRSAVPPFPLHTPSTSPPCEAWGYGGGTVGRRWHSPGFPTRPGAGGDGPVSEGAISLDLEALRRERQPGSWARKAMQVLTIDTTATPPELVEAFGVAPSAGWKRRSNCPCLAAGRSTSISYILTLVPAVHDVIHGPRILNAQLARHAQLLPTHPKSVNSDTCTKLNGTLPRSSSPSS